MSDIQFINASKKINPKAKTMLVQLDYRGKINTAEDALTLFADWFCKECKQMGYDPTIIISEISRMGADA